MRKTIEERVEKIRARLQSLLEDCVEDGYSFELEVYNPTTEQGGKLIFTTTEYTGWVCSSSPDYVGVLEWKNDGQN